MFLMVQTLLMRGILSGNELYEAVLEAAEVPVTLHDMIERMSAEEEGSDDEF
ncbi:MAG: hypothetical protein II348_00185 [Clostridia bacterium]|nr:hypothetical protein [Clostridia bacterium]